MNETAGALRPWAEGLWVADGPSVPFFGVPYPTRMAVVRAAGGALWVWSPIALTEALAGAVEALGEVRWLVAPNKLHHLALDAWLARWPAARGYAAPGLVAKRRDLAFAAEIGDTRPPEWPAEIEHVVVRGSFAMTEVVFLHAPSRTVLITDLIQRFDPAALHGWRRWIMQLDGMVGPRGSTPREWRLSFVRRRAARRARERILAWAPERLIIAHGDCAQHGAADIVADALAWMG